MIARAARSFIGFLLPALCNAGLAAWLAWYLLKRPEQGRHLSFEAFVWFYAVGGLAIVLSCAAAFLLLAADQPLATDLQTKRRWFTVALLNTILPSVLMLALVLFR